jgi:hypothetical protein
MLKSELEKCTQTRRVLKGIRTKNGRKELFLTSGIIIFQRFPKVKHLYMTDLDYD